MTTKWLHRSTLPLALVLTFSACVEANAVSGDSNPRAAELPDVQRVDLTGLTKVGPEIRQSRVAVSADGGLAFTGAFSPDGALISTSDQRGAVRARFGRTGEGPGELRSPGLMFFNGEVLLVQDMDRARVVTFTASGKAGRVGRYPGADRLLHMQRDSVDVESGYGTEHVEVRRYSLQSGGWRVVVAGENAEFRRITRPDSGPPRYVSPAYAAGASEVVVANPYTYDMQAYDLAGRPTYSFGRDVPARHRTPREVEAARASIERSVRSFRGRNGTLVRPPGAQRALDRLKSARLRHFSAQGSMHFDGQGRLWVIGGIDDSTFADAFFQGQFLGRKVLPCAEPSDVTALEGEWLALLCRPANEADEREVELQLYRLVDTP